MSDNDTSQPAQPEVIIKGSEFADRVTNVTPQMINEAASGDEAQVVSEG